jgi:hypothetical protein
LRFNSIDLKRNSSLDKVLLYVIQKAAEGEIELQKLVVEDAPGLGTATVRCIFPCFNFGFYALYMGTTLPGLLLSVPYSVSEERSPAPDTC